MKHLATVIIFALAAVAGAQTQPKQVEVKPALPPTDNTYGSCQDCFVFTHARSSATWGERITKDGHYVMTIDDPNNEYRCYMTVSSLAEESPVTFVCTKTHEVQKDSEK